MLSEPRYLLVSPLVWLIRRAKSLAAAEEVGIETKLLVPFPLTRQGTDDVGRSWRNCRTNLGSNWLAGAQSLRRPRSSGSSWLLRSRSHCWADPQQAGMLMLEAARTLLYCVHLQPTCASLASRSQEEETNRSPVSAESDVGRRKTGDLAADAGPGLHARSNCTSTSRRRWAGRTRICIISMFTDSCTAIRS